MNARARSSGGSSNTPRRYQVRMASDNACCPTVDSVADRPAGSVVHALAQILAGLEVRHVLAGERHGLPGLGVAPLARWPEVQREAAEAADLDALALRQRIAHDLENLLQRQLDVLGRQVLLLGSNYLDEF